MILEAILKINPNAKVNIIGGDVDTCTIEWLDGTAEISKADIQAKINETQYQRDRVYPSIQDQLDMQYWDNVNGTTTWKDAIAKVKSDNPKD
tara:strand:- start:470 stop:745 length:276 start_codon:yes stop_codon:yes gene_type:complete